MKPKTPNKRNTPKASPSQKAAQSLKPASKATSKSAPKPSAKAATGATKAEKPSKLPAKAAAPSKSLATARPASRRAPAPVSKPKTDASAPPKSAKVLAPKPAVVAPTPPSKTAAETAARARPASRRASTVQPAQSANATTAVPLAVPPSHAEPRAEAAPVEPTPLTDERGSVESASVVLDKLLREIGADVDSASRARASSLLQDLASRLARPSVVPDADDEEEAASFDSRESEYAARQWGRAGLRERSEDADDFGADPAFEARVRPLLEQLYRRYFRVTTRGIESVPREGRTLFVSNHSGTFPWDGLMLKLAVSLESGEPPRELRWLVEDFIFHMPFIGVLLNRLGAVRACQENAERLLYEDRLTAVFPEGIQGMSKLWNQRYQLQRFGRGGYVKLALRTRARIVPVAIVGAEETNPLLFKLSALGKPLGMPFIPITPFFPLFGPLGLAPLPSKWIITFGEPIELDEFGPDAAGDAIVVNRLNERVRTTVQTLVDEAVASRPSAIL